MLCYTLYANITMQHAVVSHLITRYAAMLCAVLRFNAPSRFLVLFLRKLSLFTTSHLPLRPHLLFQSCSFLPIEVLSLNIPSMLICLLSHPSYFLPPSPDASGQPKDTPSPPTSVSPVLLRDPLVLDLLIASLVHPTRQLPPPTHILISKLLAYACASLYEENPELGTRLNISSLSLYSSSSTENFNLCVDECIHCPLKDGCFLILKDRLSQPQQPTSTLSPLPDIPLL